MASLESFSFYQKCWVNTGFTKKATDMLILLLLLLVLTYRLVSIIHFFTFPCFLAFLCESCFTFTWFLCLCTRWTPALVTTCPSRLLQRVSEMELPAVDMFVTTADPVFEPPIITVNTVLSLLALDYPSHKLACYVSDDGCSPLTFHALVEACKFAQLWVPFCKKHHVQLRAPFRYFSHYNTLTGAESLEFKQEWLRMKDEYEDLRRRIEQGPAQLDGDLADFSNTERRNHPAIIKVGYMGEQENNFRWVATLDIHIEREAPKVSSSLQSWCYEYTGESLWFDDQCSYTLNLDCDMSVNNPMIALHAMCILLDPKSQKEVAFVQCPQHFCGALKDDPFGNQTVVLFKYMGGGLGGIQGPFYAGTNAFHRRKVLYGLSPEDVETGNTSDEELAQIFGGSKELVKSVDLTFKDKTYSPNPNVSKSLEEAHQVASCGYEYGSGWGKQLGWMYGSMTEDVLTGLTIHTKGWRSETCTPDPTAFSGCAPEGGPGSLTQQKRWGIGLLEILFTKHCPILGIIFGKLQFREAMAYLWSTTWAARSVPELCYAILPVYCIITNSTFFPRGQGIWIHVALFVVYNIHTLSEYIATGLSLRAWWNNQRMSRIVAMTAWPFSVLSVILKLLGISDTEFVVTQKEQSGSSDDEDAGRFTFNTSPMFIPGTSVLLLQLIALAIKLLRLQPAAQGGDGSGVGELFCVSYIILCYWPFLKGLSEKGKHGIPLSTVFRSAGLSFVFVHLCRRYH